MIVLMCRLPSFILASCPAISRENSILHADDESKTVCRKHVVFGKVVEGLDILKKIEAVPTSGTRNKPDVPIRIVDCGEVLPGKENGVVSVDEGELLITESYIEIGDIIA